MARTSSKMLNESGENGHPCFSSQSQGEPFQFFIIEYDINCRDFEGALYQFEEIAY